MGPRDRTRHLSQCNLMKIQHLQTSIQKDIGTPQDGLPHFLMTMAAYSVVLPPLSVLPEAFRDYVMDCLLDRHLLQMLVETRCINWCRTIKPLYPLKTQGDGNCLMHAVSIAMWGFHDTALFLRRLVYAAMVEDAPTNHIRKRWQNEKGCLNDKIPGGGLHFNSMEWGREWDMVVKMAEDCHQKPLPNTLPFHPLEEIHIFTLANVLRRPVIVVCEPVIRDLLGSTMEPNNFGGIYLPLLWKPEECVKSPLVLGYDSSHFVPLVGVDEVHVGKFGSTHIVNAVPLVAHNLEQFPIHFLLPEETNQFMVLLQDYLRVTEVTMTMSDTVAEILVAKLEPVEIQEEYNIMKDFYHQLERAFAGSDEEGEIPSTESTEHTLLSDLQKNLQVNLPDKHETRLMCIEPDCTFYGTTENGGRCSKCFEKLFGITDLGNYHGAGMEQVEPSAPTPSIIMEESERAEDLVLNTGEHSMRLAGSEGNEVYIPSITAEECIEPGCHYIASHNVYPYCHTHAPLAQAAEQLSNPPQCKDISVDLQPQKDIRRKKQNPVEAQMQHLRRMEKAASVAGEELNENDLYSAHVLGESLDDLETRHSSKCKWEKCPSPGLPRWRGLCSQHHAYLMVPLEQEGLGKTVPVLSSEKSVDLATSRKTPSPPAEEYTATETQTAVYMELNPATKATCTVSACKRKGCHIPANDHYCGFCTICFVSSNLHSQKGWPTVQQPGSVTGVSQDDTSEEMECNQSCLTDRENMASIEILECLPHSDPKLKSQAKELQKCRKDSCPGVAAEDAEGYCSWCVVSKYKNRELNLPKPIIGNENPASDPQEVAWSVGTGKPGKSVGLDDDTKKLCSTSGCEGIRCNNTGNLCLYCYKQASQGKVPKYGLDTQLVHPKHTGEELLPESTNRSSSVSSMVAATSPIAQSLTSYDQQLNTIALCAKPGCQNPGHDMQSGYCVECYKIMCTKTASLGAASEKRVYAGSKDIITLVPRCRREGCKMYGSDEYQGFCSKCMMDELRRGTFDPKPVQNKEGASEKWRLSKQRTAQISQPAKMVEPPVKNSVLSKENLLAAACKNENCTLFGDPCFDGYCSECHRKLEAGIPLYEPVEVSYSGGSLENVLPPPGVRTAQFTMLIHEKTATPILPPSMVQQCARVATTSSEQHAVIQNRPCQCSHIAHETRPALHSPHNSGTFSQTSQRTPTGHTQSPSISTVYREAAARIENQSRMSINKCKMPGCINFGHSSRQGYCNSCFVKVQQERYERL